jgi:hypothetical protein
MRRPCPFCEQETTSTECEHCGRNVTARRRKCKKCDKMSPHAEEICCHCRTAFGSELAWKIPLIIAMFVAAFILTIIVNIV